MLFLKGKITHTQIFCLMVSKKKTQFNTLMRKWERNNKKKKKKWIYMASLCVMVYILFSYFVFIVPSGYCACNSFFTHMPSSEMLYNPGWHVRFPNPIRFIQRIEQESDQQFYYMKCTTKDGFNVNLHELWYRFRLKANQLQKTACLDVIKQQRPQHQHIIGACENLTRQELQSKMHGLGLDTYYNTTLCAVEVVAYQLG